MEKTSQRKRKNDNHVGRVKDIRSFFDGKEVPEEKKIKEEGNLGELKKKYEAESKIGTVKKKGVEKCTFRKEDQQNLARRKLGLGRGALEKESDTFGKLGNIIREKMKRLERNLYSPKVL